MTSITKRYRDKDTGHRYTIEFRPEPGGTYSLWAHESPHNPVGGGVTTHHLYPSGQICVTNGCEPRTLDRAVAIAVYWMNRYSAYVETGVFPKTNGRVNV